MRYIIKLTNLLENFGFKDNAKFKKTRLFTGNLNQP